MCHSSTELLLHYMRCVARRLQALDLISLTLGSHVATPNLVNLFEFRKPFIFEFKNNAKFGVHFCIWILRKTIHFWMQKITRKYPSISLPTLHFYRVTFETHARRTLFAIQWRLGACFAFACSPVKCKLNWNWKMEFSNIFFTILASLF